MARRKTRLRMVIAAALCAVVIGGTAAWTFVTDSDSALRTIPLWTQDAAGPPLVDERAGRAFIIGSGQHAVLSVLDTHSGDVLHTIALPGHLFGSAAVAARTGRLFVLNSISAYNVTGNTVSVRDTRGGALLKTVTVPPGPFAVAVDEQNSHVFVLSTGAMTSAARPRAMDRVTMLDARSGALLASIPVRLGSGTAAMAVDGRTGRVFIASYAANAMAMLDARSGKVMRIVKVGAHHACIAVDDVTGHVFVGNEDSHSVSMLDARTGAVLHTTPAGFPTAIGVDTRAGRVVVADAGQSIHILDAHSGTVLHTLNVGGDPEGVAVDARTGRAFVTGTGNRTSILIHRIGRGQLSWLGEWRDDYTTVVDTRTGAIVRRIHAGAHTGDVAADARAGHAFVTNYEDRSISMLDATH